MAKRYKFQTLEKSVLSLQKEIKSAASLSIAEILRVLAGRGRPFILMFLTLPFCQPLQIPGLSTPFGLLIAFVGLRITFGKGIWLPQWLLSKRISTVKLKKITDKVLIIIRKLNPWLHSRLNWVCHSTAMKKVNGIVVFILGVFLSLPLPIPFSNLTAAWAIFLISIGLLEDDGVFVLIGHLIFLLTVIFFIGIAMQLKNLF